MNKWKFLSGTFCEERKGVYKSQQKKEKISDHIDKKRNFIVSSISREFSKKRERKSRRDRFIGDLERGDRTTFTT